MERTASIRVVADRVMRHPLLKDLGFDAVVDYAADFIAALDAGEVYEERVAALDVRDHRAELPCDYVRMVQVRMAPECAGGAEAPWSGGAFRYSTDSFHFSESGTSSPDRTYKVQGGMIYTSIREGRIEVSYVAMALDGEGYPLLSADPVFLRALEDYIRAQRFQTLFDVGMVTLQSLQVAQQQYAFHVAQLHERMATPSLDRAENIAAVMRTLVRRTREHETGYADLGTRENLRI